MATWTGAVNGTTNSKYRVCIDYIWADNGSGRTYTYNVYCQVTAGNFYGTSVTSNFSGNFTVGGPGVYARTSNRTVNVAYGGTFNPGTFYVQYREGKHRATVSGSESVPRPTYSVKYDANGGSGAPAGQTKTYGQTLTLSSVKPTRGGYNFLGWATSSTATTATYQPGGSYTTNAGTTLYAVWQVATKIVFNIPSFSYKVKCDDTTKVTVDSLGETLIPYSPVTVSANVNTNFYYRLYDVTKSVVSKIFGPFTGTGISNGSQTTGGATKFHLPGDIMLNTLKNLSSVTEASFYVEVCTGSNSFSSDITTLQKFDITLVDFDYIKPIYSINGLSVGTKRVDSGIYSYERVRLPACYYATNPNAKFGADYVLINGNKYTLDNGSMSLEQKTQINKDGINFVKCYPSYDKDGIPKDKSVTIAYVISDNISTVVLEMRVPAIGEEKITIYKKYNNTYNNACVCAQFIEDEYLAFASPGRCYAKEFIEDDSEFTIDKDGVIHCGQLIEI